MLAPERTARRVPTETSARGRATRRAATGLRGVIREPAKAAREGWSPRRGGASPRLPWKRPLTKVSKARPAKPAQVRSRTIERGAGLNTAPASLGGQRPPRCGDTRAGEAGSGAVESYSDRPMVTQTVAAGVRHAGRCDRCQTAAPGVSFVGWSVACAAYVEYASAFPSLPPCIRSGSLVRHQTSSLGDWSRSRWRPKFAAGAHVCALAERRT